jgi:hypothetical protein
MVSHRRAPLVVARVGLAICSGTVAVRLKAAGTVLREVGREMSRHRTTHTEGAVTGKGLLPEDWHRGQRCSRARRTRLG